MDSHNVTEYETIEDVVKASDLAKAKAREIIMEKVEI